jgi:hypothetical protein
LSDSPADQILVLSKNFRVLGITDYENAFKLLYTKKAVVMDSEYNSYTLSQWEELQKVGHLVRTIDKQYVMPDVIRLLNFDNIFQQRVSVSRENVFYRDKHRCQYCDKKLSKKEITIDHVVPRSRQQEFKMSHEQINSWTNLVSCCQSCNVLKDDRTPEEAGMRLLHKPFEPYLILKGIDSAEIKNAWKSYLSSEK